MRKGVVVLINERVLICVKEMRRVSSRIVYVGICIKTGFWSVYAQGMERSEEERDS